MWWPYLSQADIDLTMTHFQSQAERVVGGYHAMDRRVDPLLGWFLLPDVCFLFCCDERIIINQCSCMYVDWIGWWSECRLFSTNLCLTFNYFILFSE
jgi:hypothetical protein